MATVELTNAIGANTDTTDPFARLPNESFVDYLKRIKNVRGMLLGQYVREAEVDPVDDALADTIASQPLGREVVRDGGDGGDGGPVDTRTPEERQRDMMERAVGLLTGEAASGIGLGSIAGPFGMALGGFADYDTVRQFENQLEAQGYTPEQIEAIKENPSMLQQGLQTGQFGVVSEGYKPTIVDKFSITGLFSDIFGDDKPAYEGANVPGITGLGNVGARTQTYPGAVNFSQPFQTQGLLTNQQPFNVTPGFGTVLAPGYTGGSDTSGGFGVGVSGAGYGGFGGDDSTTVSTGGDTSFDTTTFDDIANDPSWGGGGSDNDNSSSSSSSSDSFGGGRDSDGWGE